MFYLIIDLYFVLLAATAQIVNLIAELVIPIGIPSKKTKSEIEIYPEIVEAKIKNVQYNSEIYELFVLSTHQFILPYLFKEIISCFIYIF